MRGGKGSVLLNYSIFLDFAKYSLFFTQSGFKETVLKTNLFTHLLGSNRRSCLSQQHLS